MKQNKYDESEFFAKDSEMRRSIRGLDEAQQAGSVVGVDISEKMLRPRAVRNG